eukprot:5249481-Pyramimonas_sp.AAC.1
MFLIAAGAGGERASGERALGSGLGVRAAAPGEHLERRRLRGAAAGARPRGGERGRRARAQGALGASPPHARAARHPRRRLMTCKYKLG